jgi:osmotically-inducible protein OsmY
MLHVLKRSLLAGLAALALLLSGCTALLIGGAAVTTIVIVNDERSIGDFIDDSALLVKINNEMLTDANLSKAAYVNVTVNHGIVLLTGTAPNEYLKQRAGTIASSTEGVRQVVNQLRIAAKVGAAQHSSDAYLASKVKTLLITSEMIDASRINVVAENGTVFLMGLITQQEADRVTSVVRRAGGVERVVKVFEIIR